METKFKGIISCVTAMLNELGRDDLATKINKTWCWGEASSWAKKNFPQELLDEFARRAVATRKPQLLYMHQLYMGHCDAVLDALIATGDAHYLCRHQQCCGHNDAVLAALIATNDASYLYIHQRHVGHREDVLAALIATGDTAYLSMHQGSCGYRDDVAEAIERIEREKNNAN